MNMKKKEQKKEKRDEKEEGEITEFDYKSSRHKANSRSRSRSRKRRSHKGKDRKRKYSSSSSSSHDSYSERRNRRRKEQRKSKSKEKIVEKTKKSLNEKNEQKQLNLEPVNKINKNFDEKQKILDKSSSKVPSLNISEKKVESSRDKEIETNEEIQKDSDELKHSEDLDEMKRLEERRKNRELIKKKYEEQNKSTLQSSQNLQNEVIPMILEERKSENQNEANNQTIKQQEPVLNIENVVNNPPIKDMFAETPESVKIEDGFQLQLPDFDPNHDNRGYFLPVVNEILNNQYKITDVCGKGVFSTVVKVIDINSNQEYAIKVIRMRDEMIISGVKEKNIIKELNEKDKFDNNYIIRMITTFEYKRHICLVFELMDKNLREIIRENKNGLPLSQVKVYSKQIVIALEFLHSYNYIHSDLKPDNIVISRDKKKVKICDFGSVLSQSEIIITQELQSRYYRAPEVILGCTYDNKIDMWSLACTLYELFTGKFLFPGNSNNEMIKLIMETKGLVTKKLKKGKFSNQFFNEKNEFLSIELDPITKREYIKEINIPAIPPKDLGVLLTNANENKELLASFKDFLDKMLSIDPSKRMDARQALCHPFLAINPVISKKK